MLFQASWAQVFLNVQRVVLISSRLSSGILCLAFRVHLQTLPGTFRGWPGPGVLKPFASGVLLMSHFMGAPFRIPFEGRPIPSAISGQGCPFSYYSRSTLFHMLFQGALPLRKLQKSTVQSPSSEGSKNVFLSIWNHKLLKILLEVQRLDREMEREGGREV